MRNALIGMLCTLGAVACGGENRPAEEPSSASTNGFAETTSHDGRGAATMTPTTPTPTAPTAPTDGVDIRGTETTKTDPSRRADAPVTTGTTNTTGAMNGASATGTVTGTSSGASTTPVRDTAPKADNTKKNERDRSGVAVTPLDQGGGNDRDITAAIRRSVVSDKSLSFNGKNVKIVTVGGKVTLRGPVKSDDEKAAIEAKAKSTSGVSDVDNQLEVKR